MKNSYENNIKRAQIAPVFFALKTVIFCQKIFYVKLFVKHH